MSGAAGAAGDINLLTLWLIAAVADALVGGLSILAPLLCAPAEAVRALGGWCDRRLNRARRSAGNRLVRGALVVVVVILLVWLLALAVRAAAGALPHGWLLEALAVLCLIDQRRAIDRVRGTAAALAGGDLAAARACLAGLVRYETASLDAHAAARAAVEAAAGRFTAGVVGAAFWYLLAGLPGLAVYRAIDALAGRIARPGPGGAFGATAWRLDGALTLLPALLAGPLLAVAALFVPGSSPGAALRLWLRDAMSRPADGAGRGEGALAGALGIALGGPRHFDGGTVPGGWVGDGRARAVAADVRRAAAIVIVACLVVAALLAAALVLRGPAPA